jgi:hypothetical protein
MVNGRESGSAGGLVLVGVMGREIVERSCRVTRSEYYVQYWRKTDAVVMARYVRRPTNPHARAGT